jgi:hypothetical protein
MKKLLFGALALVFSAGLAAADCATYQPSVTADIVPPAPPVDATSMADAVPIDETVLVSVDTAISDTVVDEVVLSGPDPIIVDQTLAVTTDIRKAVSSKETLALTTSLSPSTDYHQLIAWPSPDIDDLILAASAGGNRTVLSDARMLDSLPVADAHIDPIQV